MPAPYGKEVHMKKLFLIAALIALLIIPYAGGAAELNNVTSKGVDGDLVFYDKSGNEIFSIEAGNRKITYPSGSAVDIESGATFTVSGTFAHSRERSFGLPLNTFAYAADASPVKVTTAGIPGLEIDDVLPNIVWADGETSPVLVTFRIPTDYLSGGAFRLICTESVSTTPNRVDFDVYVNRSGRAAASSASDQTPVVLAGTTSTPSVITLTPGTDFVSLAAGDWVTIRIWRDDNAVYGATGDLEVKGVEFFYTASN